MSKSSIGRIASWSAIALSSLMSLQAAAKAKDAKHTNNLVADDTEQVASVSDCFAKGSTPHVCVLMRMAQFETAYENDLDKLTAEYGKDKPDAKLLDNQGYLNRLTAIATKYERIGKKLSIEIGAMANKKKSKALELIANYEVDRSLTDLKSRLAIMALPDRAASKAFALDANQLILASWKSFKTNVKPADREETPGLLNRLVQTRLNVLELVQNTSGSEARLDKDTKIREGRDFLAEARLIKPSKVETIELDNTELETYLAGASSRGIGDRLPRAGEDTRAPDRLDQLIDKLATSEADLTGIPGQEQNLTQVRLMKLRAPFYSPGHQNQAFQGLEEAIKSPDVAVQQVGTETLASLFNEFSGLAGSYDLMKIAQRNSGVDGIDADGIAKEFSARALAHNQSLDKSLDTMGPKLKLPTYQRVMEKNREIGEPYMALMNSLGRLSAKMESIKAAKGGNDDELVKTAMANVDMEWINLQCAMLASSPKRVGDDGLSLRTPLSAFAVDFTACLNVKDVKARNQIVHNISIKAVNLDLYKNYAWQVGGFAFDVATIALSGGVGTVVSKGLTAGFKTAGTVMLRRFAARTAIKMGTRAAAFGTKLVVGDLVGQTIGNTKNFVTNGLHTGEWEPTTITPAVFKGDLSPTAYALRMVSSQIASRAPFAAFGRLGSIAMKSARIEKAMVAASKVATGGRAIASLSAATQTMGKRLILEPVKGQFIDLANNSLQAVVGVDQFRGLDNITSVDNWIARYRGLLMSMPGGKLGDKFGDKLRSLPTKYYGELSKAGKCLTATPAAQSL